MKMFGSKTELTEAYAKRNKHCHFFAGCRCDVSQKCYDMTNAQNDDCNTPEDSCASHQCQQNTTVTKLKSLVLSFSTTVFVLWFLVL